MFWLVVVYLPIKTHVKICSIQHINVIINEPLEMAHDLREARKNDFFQRMVDMARMERLLSPILDPKHRRNIFNRISKSGLIKLLEYLTPHS